VLGQGKGGAGDRFADSKPLAEALHQRCFTGPEGTAEEKNCSPWKFPSEGSA
jgi:hypothetical protein